MLFVAYDINMYVTSYLALYSHAVQLEGLAERQQLDS